MFCVSNFHTYTPIHHKKKKKNEKASKRHRVSIFGNRLYDTGLRNSLMECMRCIIKRLEIVESYSISTIFIDGFPLTLTVKIPALGTNIDDIGLSRLCAIYCLQMLLLQTIQHAACSRSGPYVYFVRIKKKKNIYILPVYVRFFYRSLSVILTLTTENQKINK